MNLRRVAEWCGFVVAGTFIDEETGRTAVDIATDNDTVTLFDPLNDSGDAFTVLAKLCSGGVFRSSKNNPVAFCTVNAEGWSNGDWVRSETIVTDDATLRRAIVEIAEKVSKQ